MRLARAHTAMRLTRSSSRKMALPAALLPSAISVCAPPMPWTVRGGGGSPTCRLRVPVLPGQMPSIRKERGTESELMKSMIKDHPMLRYRFVRCRGCAALDAVSD